MSELLRVQNITKTFFNKRSKERLSVLNDVSFTLNQGEILGIMGNSGCGKTTLLKIIKRFEPADSGEVIFRGKNIMNSKLGGTREIQLIFQDPYSAFNPALRLNTQIREALKIGKKPESALRDLLTKFHIDMAYLSHYPQQLSGGQLQRLAIARTLLISPKILLADEPTSSLDLSIQAKTLNLFVELQKNFGISIIFVSHNYDVINYISDRIIRLGRTS